MLNSKEIKRYSRHLLLSEIGEEGQIKLKNSHVLVIGLGGLGCPVVLYLAAAGIGKLTLVDADKVDLSNLQRQVLYRMNNVSQHKTDSAEKTIFALNSTVDVKTVNAMIDESNADQLISNADVVLDCTDNVEARHLINETCLKHKKTLISGAGIRAEGQLLVLDHANNDDSPCYNCMFPKDGEEPVLNCSNSGVFGPILGIIGSMQALEAIKFLTGKSLKSHGKLKMFDGMAMEWREFNLMKNPDCSVCKKV